MPPLDPIKLVEYIRLLALAMAEGRIEAKEVAAMTDEQIQDYIARLDGEWAAAIAEGERLSQ